MRVIIVGLGTQGRKRQAVAGADCVATIDPFNPDATHKSIDDIPSDAYDAALICTPDNAKPTLLTSLLSQGKHILVEKPLIADRTADLVALKDLALANGAVCYTAYNHRFEPSFQRLKALIDSGELGTLYRCRMFYGNGTARLVRESAWRDQGSGVFADLSCHMLDAARFWFGDATIEPKLVSARCFENKAPDHVVISATGHGVPDLELEMSLLAWRNDFTLDLYAEKGSAHIRSLCKWGPATFTHRTRILPSGRPNEETVTEVMPDPTWQAEYEHFLSLCSSGQPGNIDTDIWMNDILIALGRDAIEESRG